MTDLGETLAAPDETKGVTSAVENDEHEGSDEASPRIGFIFDCDGTLMDTIDAWHRAEDELMDQAGIRLTKEQRDELNSLTIEEASEFFYRNFGIMRSPEEIRQSIVDYMLNFYNTSAELNPGVDAFVQALYAQQVPLSILSSSPQSFLQAGLGRVNYRQYFQEIVSVEDLETTKRDAQTYFELCSRLGSAPQNTWFFDDSWYALKTAQEAGLQTVGVFSKDECGTHEELGRYSVRVIDSFEELNAEDFGL